MRIVFSLIVAAPLATAATVTATPTLKPLSNGGVQASGITSVEVADGLVAARDMTGKLVAHYPFRPIGGDTKVFKVKNRAVVVQKVRSPYSETAGWLRMTVIPLSVPSRSPEWTHRDVRDPLSFMDNLKAIANAQFPYSGKIRPDIRTRLRFDMAVYNKIMNGPVIEIRAAERKVNDEDLQRRIPAMRAELNARVLEFLNQSLAATNVSLFDYLNYEGFKVPAQIYRLHKRLQVLEPIPEGSLRVDLMYLNRWLIDHLKDRKTDEAFTGEATEVKSKGYAAATRTADTWADPYFSLGDVRGLDWSPENEFFTKLWLTTPVLARPVTDAEKQAYNVDDEGIVLVAEGTDYLRVFNGELQPMTKLSVLAAKGIGKKWVEGISIGRRLEADLGPEGKKSFRFDDGKLSMTIERCTITVADRGLEVKFSGSVTLPNGRRARMVHMSQARLQPHQLDQRRNDNASWGVLDPDVQKATTKLLLLEDRFYRRVSPADPSIIREGALILNLLVNGEMKEDGLHAALVIEEGNIPVGDLDFRWKESLGKRR